MIYQRGRAQPPTRIYFVCVHFSQCHPQGLALRRRNPRATANVLRCPGIRQAHLFRRKFPYAVNNTDCRCFFGGNVGSLGIEKPDHFRNSVRIHKNLQYSQETQNWWCVRNCILDVELLPLTPQLHLAFTVGSFTKIQLCHFPRWRRFISTRCEP